MMNLRIEIKWAFIFSLTALVWMLLEKWSGLHSVYIDYHFYLTNLFAIPAIWVMVLALKDKKYNFFQGQITYFQGLLSGLLLSLFIAFLSPITQWVTIFVISPEYFPNVIERSVELGYFKTIEHAQTNFNYENYAKQSFIGSLVMGVLTTAVAMIFIRNSK